MEEGGEGEKELEIRGRGGGGEGIMQLTRLVRDEEGYINNRCGPFNEATHNNQPGHRHFYITSH